MTAPGSPNDPFAPPPAGPPASGPGYGWSPAPSPTAETESKAIVALVLAIGAYTPVVPVIGAIAALVLVRFARRDIAASGGAKKGLGLCRAASVLAWVHIGLVALGLVAAAVLLVLAAVLGVGFT